MLSTQTVTQSQLSWPMSSRHHISMEHRLRRKHLLLNPNTNASNETYLKEIQKKRKRRKQTQRQNKKRKNEKREMKNMKAGSPSNGPNPGPPFTLSLSTEAREFIFSQKKNGIFTMRTSRRFFPVLASARTTEERNEKEDEETRKNKRKGKIGNKKQKTKSKKKEKCKTCKNPK